MRLPDLEYILELSKSNYFSPREIRAIRESEDIKYIRKKLDIYPKYTIAITRGISYFYQMHFFVNKKYIYRGESWITNETKELAVANVKTLWDRIKKSIKAIS